ncbi:21521_t:CDS:2, partial [Gigaspora rosea]
VPTCTSCKKSSSRFLFPHLSPMSEEIILVPLYKRKYLSSIYLHCSLGRTPNSNPYSEYRSLIGTNDNNTNNSVTDSIYNNETLYCAANWLAQNNPYLHSLANNLSSNERIHEVNDPFPRATHILTNSDAPTINPLVTGHLVLIEDMITNNVIRLTIPDPKHKPELYAAIVANQIHTCDTRCQRSGILTQICKKDRLLLSLNEHLSDNLYHIIRIQMENLKILLQIFPSVAMLELSEDQYHALLTISIYMGPNNSTK